MLQDVNVVASHSLTAAKITEKARGAVTIHAGTTVVIDAADSIALTSGKASITLKKDGSIVIDGGTITVNGSGAVKITGTTVDNNS
jgi:type VI secretion system secreted protein VgrG